MIRHTRIFCSLRSFGSSFRPPSFGGSLHLFLSRHSNNILLPTYSFHRFNFKLHSMTFLIKNQKDVSPKHFLRSRILGEPHTLIFDSTCLVSFHVPLVDFPQPVPSLDSNLTMTLLLLWRLRSLYTFSLSLVSPLLASLVLCFIRCHLFLMRRENYYP